MRGITPIIAIILLLLMTIAAAGAAYLWITRLQSLIQEQTTSQFLSGQQKQKARMSLESIWNNSDAAAGSDDLLFTLRNSGEYNFPGVDLVKTSIYIDGALKTFNTTAPATDGTCFVTTSATNNVPFASGNLLTVQCEAGYPTSSTEIYDTVSVELRPAYGFGDALTYTFSP